jgi:hypothetical protein
VARRGAALFLAAAFLAGRDFGLTAFGAGFFLRAADFFAATTFRGAAFGVGCVRLRAGAFRRAGFLLGGIAGSLAGGAGGLVGSAG